jgi:hypothetical protein
MDVTESEEGRRGGRGNRTLSKVDRIPPREPYLREGTVLNGSSLFWHQGIYNERLSKFPHTCSVPNGKSAGSLFSRCQAFAHLILVAHPWGVRMLWCYVYPKSYFSFNASFMDSYAFGDYSYVNDK